MNKFIKTVSPIFLIALLVIVSGCGKKTVVNDVGNVKKQIEQNKNEQDNDSDGINKDDWKDAEKIYSSDDYDYTGWKTYINEELGYSVKYPVDWIVNEAGLSALTKELIIEPLKPELFVSYVNIGIDTRSIELIRSIYTDSDRRSRKIDPDYKPSVESKVLFAGKNVYFYVGGLPQHHRIVILVDGQIYSISTGRNDNVLVKQVISSFKFE